MAAMALKERHFMSYNSARARMADGRSIRS
jgi:hypothetical protein